MPLSRRSTRRAQPYRKGSPHRQPGGALTAMLAGKPANLPHPKQGTRELAKQHRRKRRSSSLQRAVRNGA